MATSNSNGDLILSLNFNTKKAAESVTDLIRQVKTTMDSLSGKGVKSNQLINLETQAQKSIQKIQNLQSKLRDLEYGPDISTRFKEMDNKAQQVEKRIDELKTKIREMSQTQVPTEQYTKLQEKLNSLHRSYDSLKAKQSEYTSGSTEYTRIENGLKNILAIARGVRTEMNNLEISGQAFMPNIDQSSKEFQKTNTELAKEEEHLANIKAKLESIWSQDQSKHIEEFKRTNEQLRTEQINLSGINSQMQNLSSDSRTSTNRISQFFRNMANNASSSYGKIRKESRRTSREANSGFGQLGKTFKTSLKTLIKYGLGMRSFFFLYRKIRSAIIDSLKELASYSSEVNSTLSDTKSAATKLKNSIATAIQPIVSVLAPVLTNVANNLSSVMNTVAQFFAALTGQSVVYQALGVQENYAGSLDETSKNADKATKSLEKYLSPLDDLNRYSENKATSSTNTSDVSPVKFTTTKVDDQFKTVADKVKNYFKDIFKPIKSAWNKYGQGVMTSWHTMLGNIKGAIKDVAIAFRNVWTNGTGERLVGNILLLWKDILDIINAVTVSFRKAFNKNSLGEQVIQTILDNFSNLLELIHSVARDFRAIWEDGAGERIWTNILTIVRNINRIIGGFWSRLKKAWDQNETGKKIWKEILGFIEDVSGWISEMSGIIAGWVEKLDFSPLLESLPKLISGFRRLWKVLSQKLKGVFENVLLPLAKWTIEEGLPKLIEAFADALEWLSDVLDAIPQYIWDGIAGGILAIVAAVVAGKKIYSICKSISAGLSLITAHPLMTALTVAAGIIAGVVTAAASYDKAQWNNSSLKKETDKINEFSDKLKEATDNMKTARETADNTLLEVQVDVTQVNKLKDRLKEIISDGLITKDEFPEYQIIKDSLKDLDGFEEAWSQLDLSEDKEGNITINDNIDDVMSRLDKLTREWEITQAKTTLSNISSDFVSSRIKNERDTDTARENVDKAYRNLYNAIESKYKSIFGKRLRYEIDFNNNHSIDEYIKKSLASGSIGSWSTEITELFDAYKSAKSTLSDYTSELYFLDDAQSKAQHSQLFLNGATTDYVGALYAVEKKIISQDTAFDLLKDSGVTTMEQLRTLANQQSRDYYNTSTSAEESASKQTSSQQKIRDESNKTTANAQENSDKQKTAARETTNSYQKEVDKWTKSNEGLRVNTSSTASTVAGYFADIANAAAKTLSYKNGESAGTNFKNGILGALSQLSAEAKQTLYNIWGRDSYSVDASGNATIKLFGFRIPVPKLATGAVIPAGKPFMAMLGDQSRGRNLEAPESLIRQIVREETANNNTGNKTYTIPVQIGSKTLFTVVLDEAKLQRMQTGYNPFVKLGG